MLFSFFIDECFPLFARNSVVITILIWICLNSDDILLGIRLTIISDMISSLPLIFLAVYRLHPGIIVLAMSVEVLCGTLTVILAPSIRIFSELPIALLPFSACSIIGLIMSLRKNTDCFHPRYGLNFELAIFVIFFEFFFHGFCEFTIFIYFLKLNLGITLWRWCHAC